MNSTPILSRMPASSSGLVMSCSPWIWLSAANSGVVCADGASTHTCVAPGLVPALCGVSLQDACFDHALNGAHRQAQALGHLCGAEVTGHGGVVFHAVQSGFGGVQVLCCRRGNHARSDLQA